MNIDPACAFDSAASRFALVRVEACVDRALGELSSIHSLGGRVWIGTLPELRCDGVALYQATYTVLNALLADPNARFRIGWEARAEGQVLVVSGSECDELLARAVNEQFVAAGGRAWAEPSSASAKARICLLPPQESLGASIQGEPAQS